jgi:hypothetical protein
MERKKGETKRKTVSFRIDPDLWKKAKKYAIDKNMRMPELVEKALKKEISIKE